MFGAALMSAIALAGASAPSWISPQQPREGTRYRAVTYWAPGAELSCSGSIGGRHVRARVYTSATHSVCVFEIPKGSAGKWLGVGWSVTITTNLGEREQDGQRVRDGSILHSDRGMPFRRLIRR
jgi:hypothetical protein